jgi:hypothetical protein
LLGPITYRATSIWLNKRLLADIDFRKFAKDDNKSITFHPVIRLPSGS